MPQGKPKPKQYPMGQDAKVNEFSLGASARRKREADERREQVNTYNIKKQIARGKAAKK